MSNPIAGNQTGAVEAVLAAVPLGRSASDLTLELGRLATQLQQLQTVNQAALESTRTNTQVMQATSTTKAFGSGSGSGSGESNGRSVAGTILSVLGTGLGLSPLISGIVHLFGGGGGGSTSEPSPLVKFALPSAQSVNAGITSALPGQTFAVDHAQGGLPRPVTTTASSQNMAQQITIQVQAMDSRSFLDHSQDIALAVRQAMLESSVLNDVVREA
jgi:hypothetical protein